MSSASTRALMSSIVSHAFPSFFNAPNFLYSAKIYPMIFLSNQYFEALSNPFSFLTFLVPFVSGNLDLSSSSDFRFICLILYSSICSKTHWLYVFIETGNRQGGVKVFVGNIFSSTFLGGTLWSEYPENLYYNHLNPLQPQFLFVRIGRGSREGGREEGRDTISGGGWLLFADFNSSPGGIRSLHRLGWQNPRYEIAFLAGGGR